MTKVLTERMSTDLGISKYLNESDTDYRCRLIYSALHAWIVTSLIPQPLLDLNNYNDGFDILSVASRVASILDNYLEIYPDCTKYFMTNYRSQETTTIKVISKYIARLCRFNLIGRISARRYINIPEKVTPIGNLFLHRGSRKFKTAKANHYAYVGIGRWYFEQPSEICISDSKMIAGFYNCDITNWTKTLFSNADWIDYDSTFDIRVYNPGASHFINKWSSIKENVLIDGFLSVAVDKYYRFFLARKTKQGVELSLLHRWYYTSREINRILFGIDALSKKPLRLTYKRYEDCVVLSRLPYLPLFEQAILSCCAWPRNCADNIFEFVVDLNTWTVIESTFENLGIVL